VKKNGRIIKETDKPEKKEVKDKNIPVRRDKKRCQ
jgi:hypothetical protein